MQDEHEVTLVTHARVSNHRRHDSDDETDVSSRISSPEASGVEATATRRIDKSGNRSREDNFFHSWDYR